MYAPEESEESPLAQEMKEPLLRPRSMLPIWILLCIAVIAGCVLLYFLLPLEDRDRLSDSAIHGILLGGVYALLALGVVVVYKATKLFNLTFGAVTMLAAFLAWWLISATGLPVWPSLLLVVILGGVFGIAVNRIFLQPLIGDSGLGGFIVTMVLGLSVFQGLGVLLFKGKPQVMPSILPSGVGSWGSISVSYSWVVAFSIAVALFLLFTVIFRYTKMGMLMRVVSEDQEVAQSLGINVTRIFAISWAIGTMTAAVCGILLGSMFTVNTELSGYSLSRAFPVLFLGGMESLPGAMVAAAIIGVVEAIAGSYIDPLAPGFREIIPWIIILAILMLRPSGLFGAKEITRL